MALQDGFKVLGLNLIASGSGYDAGGEGDDLVLRMRAPGSHSIGVGDGFTGTYSCEDPGGPITEVSITSAGKNYSSGSWDFAGHGRAAVGEFCAISIHLTKNFKVFSFNANPYDSNSFFISSTPLSLF